MRRVVFLIALVLPATLPAQVMPATVVRRGAGAGGLAMSDGEPISFILEHAQLLELSDSQRTGLMNIRRRLRTTNGPHMRQLDSLRDVLSLDMEPKARGLTDEDRKKLSRFEQLSLPITDSIKVNNEAATVQARLLLDSLQVVRLDSVAARERGRIDGQRPPARPPRY